MKKKQVLLSVASLLGLVAIMFGVTYAFFNYAKEGTTENTISTGTITFLYTEVEANGAGISITDAFPVSDTVGKAQTGNGKVFNFTVQSTIRGDAQIPYEVTARKSSSSTLNESAIKLYLTEVNGMNETELTLEKYSDLSQTTIKVPSGTIEKTIYKDTVPANTDYSKAFRLRMWIDETIDFSDGTNNNKSFHATINVYSANAQVDAATTFTETEIMSSDTALKVGDAVTAIDGSRWHVVADSSSDSNTVTLLSDYNLKEDGTYNTVCGSKVSSGYYCNPVAFDTTSSQEYNENNNQNIAYFIKNIYEPKVLNSLSGTTEVTIPTAEMIASFVGTTFANSTIELDANAWYLTTNYWTKTPSIENSSYVFAVYGINPSLRAISASTSEHIGVKPVITTLKTNLYQI